MAGHSQFKNIMHRKGAQDSKRAKLFTKLIRELTVAAKAGEDPDSNPRLRTAIIAARSSNLPKETMERAIKRGCGGEDGDDYQEMRYEGYGPHGVALIIQALTDNKNRTAAEIRSYFNKSGGSLGETNSVAFQFDHLGYLRFLNKHPYDQMLEWALDLGAEDVNDFDDSYEIFTPVEALTFIKDGLQEKGMDLQEMRLIFRAKNYVPISAEQGDSLDKLITSLEDNDDVQYVFTNAHIEGS